MNGSAQMGDTSAAFEEPHFAISHWADLWGFSEKTIREWFRDECGPGVLRLENVGRRKKRGYTTLMISPRAAARVYQRRTGQKDSPKPEVM
jgi:hypothetical protein